MRIVVAGSNGLVGSRLCRLMAEKGAEVVGIGRGPRRVEGRFEYRPCDLTLEEEVRTVLHAAQPEVIVNTASMTEVDRCEKEPEQAYAANVDAPALLAKAARQLKSHLIHVSTDYVFDGDHGPYTEQDIPNPKGTYAITKHMGEEAVRVLAPSWTIARTAVVYGWPKAGRPNFGAWLAEALEKKQPVRLFEDQFVSPSLADNVAEMLAELAERRLSGIWNLAGATVIDRVNLGKAFCEVFGFDPSLIQPIRMKDANLPSPRPLHSGLVTDKAARELSAKPLALAEALQRFRAAYMKTQ